MIKIKSFSELKKLLVHGGNSSLSNNYLFPNELTKLIDNGRLYYINYGNNLFLLKSRFDDDFFEVYYFINDEQIKYDFKLKLPLVIEIPFRGNTNFPQQDVDYLLKLDFKLHIKRDLFVLNALNFSFKEVFVLNSKVDILKDISYAVMITDIIKYTFDYYTGDILTVNEVTNAIINNEILVVYQGDYFAGFLRYYIKNKVSWIGHIVVLDEFSGKGLGKQLVYEYLNYQKLKGIHTFQHWVVSDNSQARKLYEYFGFSKMNKSSISLIKK